MKRLIILLLSFLPLMAAAQQTNLIMISAATFVPVHTDAISGVPIDRIERDPSMRPCARIKMHINRMTKEDIQGLTVRAIGGNVEVTKQMVAIEGNGLIIEMTAKPGTRFYLHHEKYGDSNEVSLDLEGDKEYKIEAMLNTLLPIVVNSNTIGAEVYIDNAYKGQIGKNYSLTVSEITPGVHKIKIQHGALIEEKEVKVTSTSIYFRIDLNVETARPQYVIFKVEPTNAVVVIDGKTQIPDSYGYVKQTLYNGTYTYAVSAKNYHEERGEFVVNGYKIEKEVKLRPAYGWVKIPGSGPLHGANIYIDGDFVGKAPLTSNMISSGVHKISIVKDLYKAHEGTVTISDNVTTEYTPALIADFANVTLTTSDGSAIYINNEFKSKTSWSGVLATGTYIFETRKENHHTKSYTKEIVATSTRENITLPSPTPILGAINIDSTPPMAEIYIDGKLAGRTPLILDYIIGKHTVTIRKDGFAEYTQNVTIAEGVTTEVNCILAELSSSSFQKKSKMVKAPRPRPELRKGFESMVDMSCLFASESGRYTNLGVDYIAGYRFNNFLYLGVGAGIHLNVNSGPHQLHYSNYSDYYGGRFLNPGKYAVPAYCYFRANFSNTFCSPFFALSLGGSFSPNQRIELNMFDFEYNTISHFMNPQLGVNFRMKKRKMSIYTAIGLQCFTAPYSSEWTSYSATIGKRVTCGGDLHFGFTF